MKTLITAVVLSASFFGTAYAQEATEPLPVHQSSVTRAQVQAELNAAVSQNLIPNGEQDFTFAARDTSSSLSRAQVVQALQEAKAQGLVTTGEADNVPVFASHDGPTNRGQVVLKASNRFNS